jgi:hypothetical protein
MHTFLIVMFLITGQDSQWQSPPLPLAECRALRTQKMLELSHREDINGLMITECRAIGLPV